MALRVIVLAFLQGLTQVACIGSAQSSVTIPTNTPSSTPSPTPAPADLAAARQARANAGLFGEMVAVILMRDPKAAAEFGTWVDALNQGASVEGVYNGLTHSSNFRALEENNKGASIEALKAFGRELTVLEKELPHPTEFDANAALPLALPNQAGRPPALSAQTIEEDPDIPREVAWPTKSKRPPTPDLFADKYSRQFVGASIFTLKRIIGDEALKVISLKRTQKEQLATWYSKWTEHMSQLNINFGLPLRNSSDVSLHYQWAIQSSEDRIIWEVLNRLHRVLNEANTKN